MNDTKLISVFESADIEKNKVVSALAYVIFFIPLLASPDSSYGRFHANQGLLLLIVAILGRALIRILPFLNGVVGTIFGIVITGLAVYGIINAIKGKGARLPVIGQFNILG